MSNFKGASLSLWVLVALLVWGGSCLTTLTQTFDYSNTSPIRSSIYPLGTLSANSTLNVKVKLWISTASLNNGAIILLDGNTLNQVFLVDCLPGTSCQLNYYITTTKTYKLQVTATTITPFNVKVFNLIAEVYPGATTFVGNPNSQVVLRLMDAFRLQMVFRYIYIEKQKKIKFTIFPQSPALTNTNQALRLSPISANYQVTFLSPIVLTKQSYANQLQTFSVTLNPGYYAFAITHAAQSTLQVSWQTDAYACPNNPDFVDYYGLFTGCTRSDNEQGLPCVAFNKITLTCTACISGYALQNGSCLANTTCPDRQFFHYGSCFNVSDACGKYDPFTGACFDCKSADYDFIDGGCLRKSANCTDRQWELNYACFNVSEKCKTFDPTNGHCLTCSDPLFEVAADGSCVPIVVVCPQGQYAVGLTCVTIPVECKNFDKTREICLECIQGYFVENGVCKRILCPNGQAPSRFGLFCIDVSPLCDTYDQLSGFCLSCKQPNHRVNAEGKCVQFNSPLSGCSERQRLGFGRCENADSNCKAYNLVTSDCDECESGFYLDYTGHCAKSPQCGASQWSVNGECIRIPENCLTANALGLCTQCVNRNYRLEYGQCVYFKSCAANQYQNALGECVDVSPSCAVFNPSNGECVTCKSAEVSPNFGVCCPVGQIYNRNVCVNLASIDGPNQTVASGSDCLRFHPSLGYCLSCAQGFTPDPVTLTACIPL